MQWLGIWIIQKRVAQLADGIWMPLFALNSVALSNLQLLSQLPFRIFFLTSCNSGNCIHHSYLTPILGVGVPLFHIWINSDETHCPHQRHWSQSYGREGNKAVAYGQSPESSAQAVAKYIHPQECCAMLQRMLGCAQLHVISISAHHPAEGCKILGGTPLGVPFALLASL